MGLMWWILPAIAGVIGLMLTFAGLGKLFRLKPFSGGSRLVFGTGFMGLGAVVAFTGLNLQTYKRLTFERPVATISFAAVQDQTDQYVATLLLPEGQRMEHVVTGDEFILGARVITFKALSNLLGYDSVYRLDRLDGRYMDVERANETNAVRLTENPGLDVHALAKEHGGRFGVRDANFGSAVYNPMSDGLAYEVSITRTGLIARAANEATRRALGVEPAAAVRAE